MKMRAGLAEIFYNAGVTEEDFWRAVGDILALRMKDLKWAYSDVEAHDGPSYHTVEKILGGQIGRTKELRMICRALGFNVVDVFLAALDVSRTPLSGDVSIVVGHYLRTTEKGRRALMTVAEALPDAEVEHPAVRRLPSVPPAKAPRKR